MLQPRSRYCGFAAGSSARLSMTLSTRPNSLAVAASIVSPVNSITGFFSHMILPWIVLALLYAAFYARMTRNNLLETLGEDYIRTARAKGLDETRVVTRHVLRNALLPMVTLIGLQAGTMLGGSVVVESVFSLPGLGRLAYESVVQRDLNTLLGIVFVSALLVISINFVVDLIYARLDPRITAEG